VLSRVIASVKIVLTSFHLWLLLPANNSFKPTPLRSAA